MSLLWKPHFFTIHANLCKCSEDALSCALLSSSCHGNFKGVPTECSSSENYHDISKCLSTCQRNSTRSSNVDCDGDFPSRRRSHRRPQKLHYGVGLLMSDQKVFW